MAKATTETMIGTDEEIDAALAGATPIERDANGKAKAPPAPVVTPEALSEFQRLLQKEVTARQEREEVPIIDGRFVPKSVDGMWRLAQFYHKADMLPHGVKTVAQVFLVISTGAAVGMDPTQSLKNLMIVNNRVSVYGDGLIGLVRGSGKCEYVKEWVEGEGEKMVAWCETRRKGEPEPVRASFSVAEAKKADLWNKTGYNGKPTPWITHPKRMLAMRARAFCLRDVYADVLGGLSVSEEMHEAQDRRGTFDSSRMKGARQSDAAAALDAELTAPSSPAEPGGDRDSAAEEPASPDADSAGWLYQ